MVFFLSLDMWYAQNVFMYNSDAKRYLLKYYIYIYIYIYIYKNHDLHVILVSEVIYEM